MPKQRYVIKFTGLFEVGYVKFTLIGHKQEIEFANLQESLKFATKFKFKFIANICCWFLNNTGTDFTLRVFEVISK